MTSAAGTAVLALLVSINSEDPTHGTEEVICCVQLTSIEQRPYGCCVVLIRQQSTQFVTRLL